jgi:hypothetical protein
MPIRVADPRVEVIEGRRTLVVERNPPLPETLELLLQGGRDRHGRVWRPLHVTARAELRLQGARSSCLGQDHRLTPWLQGTHIGSDLVIRSLLLLSCLDCGAVCARDRSHDTLDRLPTGGRPSRRRDHVIAWYAGARPLNRLYGGRTQ